MQQLGVQQSTSEPAARRRTGIFTGPRARWEFREVVRRAGFLARRTAVVTGASSRLGEVTARKLARAGARVVLAVRNRPKGEQAASTMPVTTELRTLDVSDLASVRAFAAAWAGDLDILINNAGI
jgi:NADP-dependent 3-hydroxy acid dehydrogenase YdfG